MIMRVHTRTISIAAITFALLAASAGAEAPRKITITPECVGFPEGTTCEVEIAAEFRIVRPKVTKENRGRYAAITDDQITYRVSAAERHRVDLTRAFGPQQATAKHFVFTMPAALPAPQADEVASIGIPVRFTVVVPGEEPLEQEMAFGFPVHDGDPAAQSRCLRIEWMPEQRSVRAGLLPTCAHRFADLHAFPLPQ
jgi:hypothetical protein